MKITILGSGTATPNSKRNSSGYLLEIENKKILFDSGPGIMRQLLKNKTKLQDIDHIFYTHFHNDHINDLPAIVWGINYGGSRKNALNLYGPKKFKKYFKVLMKKILQIKKLYYKINIFEIKNNSITVIKINSKKLIVKTNKSPHTFNSVAYRIEYDGKTIVYSGDTDYSKDIIDLSKNTDLLILECTFPDNKKMKGHLTPSSCGKIATQANVKKLVLTHINPELFKVDLKKQCSKAYKGKIVLAKDNMGLVV